MPAIRPRSNTTLRTGSAFSAAGAVEVAGHAGAVGLAAIAACNDCSVVNTVPKSVSIST